MTMKKFKLKYGDVSTFTSATPSGVVDYLRNNSRYPMSGEDQQITGVVATFGLTARRILLKI